MHVQERFWEREYVFRLTRLEATTASLLRKTIKRERLKAIGRTLPFIGLSFVLFPALNQHWEGAVTTRVLANLVLAVLIFVNDGFTEGVVKTLRWSKVLANAKHRHP